MDELFSKPLKRRPIIRKLAMTIITAFVFIILFADFIAPYDHTRQSRQEPSAPSSPIHFRDAEGNFNLRPLIYSRRLADPLMSRYEENTTRQYPIEFFVQGDPYSFLGLIPTQVHLFGAAGENAPRLGLLGTDALGRDRFSRLLIAIRFSLIVCPVGAFLACLIGVLIGSVSGYAHRSIDMVLMGAADSMLALPTLILILAARAAFPLELPPMRAAILLILIFALTGWAEMARLARGLVRSFREREFVLAARSIGLTETRILFRHIFPNAAPTLLTQATIMLPYFLLAEVALSFLGVGLQEPQPSLGNMLAAASDLTQLQVRPFLLLSPAFVIFLFVFALRILSERRSGENKFGF